MVIAATRVWESRFGRALRTLDVGGIRLCETLYAPEEDIPDHAHPWAGLCLTLDGGYEEAYGRTKQRCGPASLVFHPPGEVFSDRISTSGSRCLTVAVDPGVLRAAADALPTLGRLDVTLRSAPTWLVFQLRSEFALHDDLSPAAVESSVFSLLAALAERPGLSFAGSPPAWLDRVRERIQDEFDQRQTLDSLAQTAGVHRVHLARAFRQHYDCTVGDYTRQRRVEFACHQLIASRRLLSDIALSAGFGDQAHFTHVFRRLVGLTPGAFRSRFARR